MQSPYLHLCKPFSTNSTRHLAFRRSLSSETPFRSPFVAPQSANPNGKFIVRCVRKENGAEAGKIEAQDKKHNTWSIDNEMAATEQQRSEQQRRGRGVVRGKRARNGPVLVSGGMLIEHEDVLQTQDKIEAQDKKHNAWSIDNEMAATEQQRSEQQRRGRGRRVVRGKRARNGPVLVSGRMLIEHEDVLQTQENLIKPLWHTFESSVSGIWKGVGAVFSPITAEMEPLDVGKKNEHLYDCYTVSHVKAVPNPSGGQASEIQRKINWVTLNPYGEVKNSKGSKHTASANESATSNNLPRFDSFDFGASDVMEEDVMANEPGLVFFEDGSYSRGPVDIPVGDIDDSKYYPSPTFKFEQCLATGQYKRLRIVHTIEFSNGGSEIQIMRVAVYDEVHEESDVDFDAIPLSQQKRTQPSDLSGSWKVFGMGVTPIYGEEEDMVTDQTDNTAPWVYRCSVTVNQRSLPENHVYFGEEEMQDMKDGTILWLPGGITAYVDINNDGILCIGAGWYSDEGTNLVTERYYGLDGKLKEVRWKSEEKRWWSHWM